MTTSDDGPPTRQVQVLFVTPGGVMGERFDDGSLVQCRGAAFLIGTGDETDLMRELGRPVRERVPWRSREARREALERIASGDACGSSELGPEERLLLLEHVATTPFLRPPG